MENKKKECLHKFRSVYPTFEWEVECVYCEQNVFDLYSKEDANIVIERMIEQNKK